MHPFCRFTQNLSAFRREVNDSMKNSTYGVNSNDMMSWQLSDSTLQSSVPLVWSRGWTVARERAWLIPAPSSRGMGEMAKVNQLFPQKVRGSTGKYGVCVHSLRDRALLVPGGLGWEGVVGGDRRTGIWASGRSWGHRAGRARRPAAACLV